MAQLKGWEKSKEGQWDQGGSVQPTSACFKTCFIFSCQIVARWDNEGCGVCEWGMSQRKGEFLFQRPVSAPSLEEEAMGFLTLEASPRLQITTLSLHLDGATATRYLLQGGLKPHLHIFSHFYRLKVWDLGAGAGGVILSSWRLLFLPLSAPGWYPVILDL